MDIEWLILADAAQVVGGKLYLLGGGWDVLTVNAPFPVQQKLTIAAAFRVPWHETNQPHAFTIEIVDEDGRALLTAEGKVEVGRPPGLPFGTEQRSQLALDVVVNLERPGTYAAIARLDEQEARSPFRVVAGQGAMGPPRAGAS